MARLYKEEKEIDKAITYMADSFSKYGTNRKPVVLHSLKVGLLLEDLGYQKDVVIGGILHDIIEDTSIDLKDIQDNFGMEVAELVEANSFNPEIADKEKQYQKSYANCLKKGKDALIIRAADVYQNTFYYKDAPDRAMFDYLIKKLRYFLKISEKTIGTELIYKLLSEKLNYFLEDKA